MSERIRQLDKTGAERNLRGAISDANRMFKANPQIFTCERYQEDFQLPRGLDDLRKRVNQGTKNLMELGGAMPNVLRDSNLALEELELLLGRDGKGLYTVYKTIDKGTFGELDKDPKGLIKLRGWIAMRAQTVLRGFGANPYPKDLEGHLDEQAPIETDRVVGVNDILRVLFSVQGHGNGSLPLDFGWKVPGVGLEELLRGTTDNRDYREGFVRRHFINDEVARREARQKLGELYTGRAPYGLTFIRESRTDTGLQRGVMPEFWNKRLRFGGGVDDNARSIREQVEALVPTLLEEILVERDHILRRKPQFGDGFLRGGRENLNPSDLYTNLAKYPGMQRGGR